MKKNYLYLSLLVSIGLNSTAQADFSPSDEFINSFSHQDQNTIRNRLTEYPLPIHLPTGRNLLLRMPHLPYTLWGQLIDSEYNQVSFSGFDNSELRIYISISKDATSEFHDSIQRSCDKYEPSSRPSTWRGERGEEDLSSLQVANFIGFWLPLSTDFQVTFSNTSLSLYTMLYRGNEIIYLTASEEALLAAAEYFQNLYLPPPTPAQTLTWTVYPEIEITSTTATVTYDFSNHLQDYWWRVESNQGQIRIIADQDEWWVPSEKNTPQSPIPKFQVENLAIDQPLELTFYAISPDGKDWYSARLSVPVRQNPEAPGKTNAETPPLVESQPAP